MPLTAVKYEKQAADYDEMKQRFPQEPLEYRSFLISQDFGVYQIGDV